MGAGGRKILFIKLNTQTHSIFAKSATTTLVNCTMFVSQYYGTENDSNWFFLSESRERFSFVSFSVLFMCECVCLWILNQIRQVNIENILKGYFGGWHHIWYMKRAQNIFPVFAPQFTQNSQLFPSNCVQGGREEFPEILYILTLIPRPLLHN